MSKKKAKKAAKKAPKKAAKKATMKAAKPASRSMAAAPAATPGKRTSAATIFVYDAGGATRVRTSPQRLVCAPGFVEWTVVNLTSGAMPNVDITWKDNDSPWGGAPIPIRDGNARIPIAAGAKKGTFKYFVNCNGYCEDPEVEFPEQ